jgi:hypothetical protein
MRRWALQRGHAFLEHTEETQITRDVYWEKIYWLDRLLNTAGQDVLWLDVDCLIVGDLQPDQVFSVSCINTAVDLSGHCCAVLYVPNNDHSRDLIRCWRTCGQMAFEPNPAGLKYDQATLKHLIATFLLVRSSVCAIPGLLSDPTFEVPDAFVYHAWASARGMEQAIEQLRIRTR